MQGQRRLVAPVCGLPDGLVAWACGLGEARLKSRFGGRCWGTDMGKLFSQARLLPPFRASPKATPRAHEKILSSGRKAPRD